MSGTRRERRSNVERTTETRARILDATLGAIAELGVARTTTLVAAERAGVSRGALLHHYPSRAELQAAAVRHLVERRADEVSELLGTVPEGSERLAAAITVLWQIVGGADSAAWIEVQVAARTDDELRPLVAELRDELADTIQGIWAELFPLTPGTDETDHRVLPTLLFRLLDGLALARFTGSARAEAETTDVLALIQSAGAALPQFADTLATTPTGTRPPKAPATSTTRSST